MTVATLIFAGALVLLAAAFVFTSRPPRPGAVLSGRTVTVNTRRPDDQSIRGVLVAHHSDRLTLTEAVYVMPGDAADIEIPGTVHVPIANVAFLQEH